MVGSYFTSFHCRTSQKSAVLGESVQQKGGVGEEKSAKEREKKSKGEDEMVGKEVTGIDSSETKEKVY